MSIANTISPFDGTGPNEVLYQSPTTRIVRLAEALAAGGVVCKEYLGPHAAQRLRNEKDLLKRLAGIEGVVSLAQTEHGADVLALRDSGGSSLARVLQEGKCNTETILTLAVQLASVLGGVHRAGVIHRDINPANILVCTTGQIVLIDFDLATLAAHSLAGEPAKQIAGTLTYMAPEQTGRTGRAVDQRADLYALGATLYEMATGRPPFEQADALALIHDHLVLEPVAPWRVDAAVPRGLSDIILRLLAKAPEQRYQSADGLLHDLQRLRGELEQASSGSFELGERDFAARLAAPARLVGRDAELGQLHKAFADAMHTPRRTVLIAGPAGVGKSALTNELRPVVAKAGGWFVYGKFDQYQQDGSTDGALTQALRGLGRLLLTQPADQVEAQRQRILHSLGRDAGMITRASPEFALLLGRHDDVQEADPRQAERQMQRAMLDLLGAVATPSCPLVVVVDDLQWAGAFSFRLFERMMVDLDLRGVLLVGSYRSGEDDDGHAFAPVLAQWREHAHPPEEIELANLGMASVSEITRDMLRLAPGPARELSEALNALTGGNPFDTIEMINALRADGVLSLKASGWQWDEARVRHFVGRGNVVDLLAARIGRLPVASRELLELMSSLGSSVDRRLLGAASGLGDDELRARLRAPLDDGLLLADLAGGQDSVRFRHDRVQQAMLGAIHDPQRAARQLAMARRLASEPGFEAEAAAQYLACVDMLNEPSEQRRAAHMFHSLAQVLASTATFMLAERYLAAADGLLAGINDPGDAALRLAIDVARHRALYSLARVDEADPLFARIQARTQDPLDLVDPTGLQMRRLDVNGRMSESLTLGVDLLAKLGVQVPPDFSDPDREQRLDALKEWVGQESQRVASMRAQAHDARLQGVYKLLSRITSSAYHSQNINAMTWVALEAQRLWVEHGPSKLLMGCVNTLGTILVILRQDYRTAYDIGRHLIAVGEALGFEVNTAGTRFLFAWATCPWMEPLENALDHATRACEVFQAKSDDASHSCYFNIPKYQFLLEIAPTLDSCEAELDAAMALSRRTGNVDAAAQHIIERQFVRALRGQTKAPDSFDDDEFNEQAFLAEASHLPTVALAFAPYRAFQALLWGHTAELVRLAAAPGYDGIFSAWFRSLHNMLFRALARSWQLHQQGPAAPESAALVAAQETSRNWLARRAADQPYNFLHLLLLVDAEQAWALGDLWKAAATFDAAVVEAGTRQRPWHRALICERAGLFNLAQGLTGAGRDLLARARDQYQAWGATAKVDQMQRDHAFLRTPARSLDSHLASSQALALASGRNLSPDVLDLVGVLRASQALSSETSLERLTSRVSDVLASLTGATKVLVLSRDEEAWWLLPYAQVLSSLPVAQAGQQGLLPLSAFAYAQRTGEVLMVDDAAADDRFARDPYFAGVPVCSLLLVPIASQGAARGMLLLENRLGRAAFNTQRLDAVMLIAGQLAVSLANAQLYESLEQRVQARTRELQETQAQLVTTARRAGMAEIANNVLHNVGNVLNSINVSAKVMRGNIDKSRIEGLARAVDLINEHEHDLPRFIEADPRGKALWPYLNRLVGALRTEREEILKDLDRLTLSVDHVTYVVATQQSHAGPSSVQEMARPEDLIEEALFLSAEAIKRGDVSVVRRHDEVPPSALDKQRLVQVLVNLIGNAVQAMQSVPAQARQLTLCSCVVHAEDGALLRITVQDAGEGISAGNLTRIFSHGFTTRMSGHGFGLHSSAVAATEMGGKLTVHSDGPGHGAIFTIDLPLKI